MLAIVMGIVGCGDDSGPAAAPAVSDGTTARCEVPADAMCFDWRPVSGLYPQEAERVEACRQLGGTLKTDGQCPNADTIGACRGRDLTGLTTHYQAGSDIAQGREDCTHDGTWSVGAP